jgi:hypothetical protein
MRKRCMLKILDWLELHPGSTWQQRWAACGAEAGDGDWRDTMMTALDAAGRGGAWTSEARG